MAGVRSASRTLRRPCVRLARPFAVAVLFALLTGAAIQGPAFAQFKPDTKDVEVRPIDVTASPISGFEKLAPARHRFGRLEWRGGLVLTSSAEAFGGWSGLALEADGERFVAVSDAGVWMTGRIGYDGDRPAAITDARLGPLQALGGKTLKRNRDRDAEAVAIDSGTLANGTLLVSFEQHQRIGRFDIDERGLSAPRGYLDMPPEMKRKRKGDGLEAMTVLRGGPWKGAVVAFAEHLLDAAGRHTGWMWVKGKPQPLALADIDGYAITGAASLADGSLLVLERRFRWFDGVKMRLRLVGAAELQPGAAITGETLIDVGMGHEIDNMEGIAVHRGRRGETVVTLLSDDNFNGFLQRTLLLQFTLLPAELAGERPAAGAAAPR